MRTSRLVFATVVAMGIMATGVLVRAQEQSHVVVPSSADTYLRSGAPNTNEGGSPLLRLQASGNNRALVRFDTEAIIEALQGRELISARIELCVMDNPENWGRNDDRTVSAHRLLVDWAEGVEAHAELPGRDQNNDGGAGATWNCPIDANVANSKPDGADWGGMKGGNFAAIPSDTIFFTNDTPVGEPVYWNVTADVQDILDGGDNFGWLIKKDKEGQSGKVGFASREFPAYYAAKFGDEPAPCTGPMLVLVVANTQVSSTLTVTQDAYLRSGANNTNEGGNRGLEIAASGSNRVLVGFGPIPNAANVKSATLVLTIMDNANNWGASTEDAAFRTVDAHRLLVEWAEGNGANEQTNPSFRGTGPGVTWRCPIDPDISNSNDDGAPRWDGGTLGVHYAENTSPPVVHFNGQTGEVSWDVTQDVIDGADFGWMVRKTSNQTGRLRYYSKEGAAAAGEPTYAARLLLEY